MNIKINLINRIKKILIIKGFSETLIYKKNNFFLILFYYMGLLFNTKKSLFNIEVDYLLKNQLLFSDIIKLVDKEMIFNFSVVRSGNNSNIFFYKYLYHIYRENYNFVLNNSLDYYKDGGKYILYTEKIDKSFHTLNEIGKDLYLVISFNPYSESFVYEEACGGFRFEFYIVDNNKGVKFKEGHYYRIDTDDYYACSFYVGDNDILISGLQGSDIYIDYLNFRINNFFFNFIDTFKNIYNIDNVIGLSNNIYFCKHHKNYNGDYDNIFKKYGFTIDKNSYYKTNNLKFKNIENYNYTSLIKKIYER